MQPSGEHPGKADVDSNSYVRDSPLPNDLICNKKAAVSPPWSPPR